MLTIWKEIRFFMVIRMLWKIMGINREMVNQKIQDNSLYCKVSSYSSWIVNLFVWISQVLEEKVNFPQRKRRKGREMLQKNTDFMRTSMRNIYFLLAKANLGWPTICRILMMSWPLDSACQSLIQIQVNGELFGKMSIGNNPHRWVITGEREHTLGVYINGLWKSCVSWNDITWGIMK